MYKTGDEEGILRLLKRNSQGQSATWSWQHQENPEGSIIAVAEDEGKIIGHSAYQLVRMKLGDSNRVCAHGVDLNVDRNYRRKGLATALYNYLEEQARERDVALAYGFPTEVARKVYNCKEKTNLRIAKRYFDVSDSLRANYPFLNKHIHLAAAISKFGNLVYSRRLSYLEHHSLKIRKLETFDSSIDDLWIDASKDYNAIAVRDSEYLNWRYFKNPARSYLVYLAEDSQLSRGYVVITQCGPGEKSGCIVDIFCRRGDLEALELLIGHALKEYHDKGVGMVQCWVNSESELELALKHARFRLGINVSVVAKNLVREPVLDDPQALYLSMGDSDFL